MNKPVLEFLDDFYSKIIMSSIDLSQKGKRLDFHFRMPETELKAGIHRERITASLIKDVTDYFSSSNAEVSYHSVYKEFSIKINLIKAVFNPTQARYLSAKWSAHE
jgi:hypothetical protein